MRVTTNPDWDPVHLAQEVLLWRQRELHIARYLASGVQPRTGPSMDYRRRVVEQCEQEVKKALDALAALMDE